MYGQESYGDDVGLSPSTIGRNSTMGNSVTSNKEI